MILEDFKTRCREIFAHNPELTMPTDEQCERLYLLTEHMLKVNESMNLTAIKEWDAVILKHYADSLSVSKYIPEGARVIDIGCGAGFPSLPLAIFREDLSIVPFDATAKRIEYVKGTAGLLGLSNVSAIAGRAEDFAKKEDFRERFDISVARAVADLPILCELCLPFVKVGGSFVAMKAAKGESELQTSMRAIELCGGRLRDTHRINLNSDGSNFEIRLIAEIEKIGQTPAKYPRNYSQIAKKHL